MRCFELENFGQPRDQLRGGGIGHRHNERLGRVRGIKVLRVERNLELLESRPHLGPEFFGARSRLKTFSRPFEQRVVQVFSQAAQCIAHRRLCQRQCFGGTREAFLRHDGVKHAQEVQVQIAKIDWRWHRMHHS